MEESHKLTLYIAYYLSRYNQVGLKKLGYSTWNGAFIDIAKKLNVNRYSVKNWRDEFDPIHSHRAGWYQRPMSPSRIRVVQALEDLDEKQIREIVKDIISGKIQNDEEELEQLLNIVSSTDSKQKVSNYIVRGPAGKAAEEFFINHYRKNQKPYAGNLIDCRDLGVGYDFRIISQSKVYYIEIKGLSNYSGGVLFTNKEWTVAKKESDSYYLCIVSNLKKEPELIFIQNPAEKLNAKKNLYTTLQISWSITQNQLDKLND
ncbi:MAG: DUF3883 domain-containing protein [Bacteroidales bacterium]|nr:DUF3883 domain-containing protein [Bacteroidales bacterium]